MRSKKTVVLAVLFVAVVLAAIVLSTPRRGRYRCEICITYQGRQACRTASAETREGALRTATENACAQISAGVTDSQQCEHTPPDKLEWIQ